MKKIVIAVLILSTLLLLGACAGQQKPNGTYDGIVGGIGVRISLEDDAYAIFMENRDVPLLGTFTFEDNTITLRPIDGSDDETTTLTYDAENDTLTLRGVVFTKTK